MPRPLRSTLFPYTTLFRSALAARRAHGGPRRGRRRVALPVAAGLGARGDRGVAPPGAPAVLRALLRRGRVGVPTRGRSEEHTSELQSQSNLVCRLLLEKKN